MLTISIFKITSMARFSLNTVWEDTYKNKVSGELGSEIPLDGKTASNISTLTTKSYKNW